MAIGDTSTSVFVSAASAWEIATMFRIGELPGAGEVAERFAEIVDEQDFDSLPISVEHARAAGLMPGDHRDPFDRMLIAQSQIEGLTLVSPECRVFPRDTRRVRPAAAGTREMATTLFEAADVLRS